MLKKIVRAALLSFGGCLLVSVAGFANQIMPSEWQSELTDGTNTGAKVEVAGDRLSITGTAKDRSYGYVFSTPLLDMDKQACLTVDVEAVPGAAWYILLRSSKLDHGYIRIQPDSNLSGKQFYDLKAITKISGKIDDAELQLGVSSGGQAPNEGKKAVFKSLKFIESSESIPGVLRMSDWQDKWPDGTMTGAAIRTEGGQMILSGTNDKQSYGTVNRVISVDLDRTPYLVLESVKVEGFWYLLASGGSLKDRVVKIQRVSKATGVTSYNLKDVLGMSGEQNFVLQLGLSSGSAGANLLKSFTFKNMAFSAEAPAIPVPAVVPAAPSVPVAPVLPLMPVKPVKK
jgi:hypothetical protein